MLSLFDHGPCAPCPRPFNMAAQTFAAGRLTPDKIALEVLRAPGDIAESWTHAALRDAVLRTAGGLAALGIVQGDRILLRLGNSSDFPILFFAAIALGAVPVPTSALLTPAELSTIHADLAPRLTLHGPGLDPGPGPALGPDGIKALRNAAAVAFAATDPDNPAYMVYTSGTGGQPKGVVHAQRAAWARRMMWDGWYGLGPTDRVLHAGAFNWTYTLGAGLTDPWAIGATALIHTGPADPGIWARLATAHRATIFAAAPGVYRQLLKAVPDIHVPTLRHGLSAGESLPETTAQAWRAATGTPIYEALGMSEVSTYISFSPSSPPVPGRSGRPQPGRSVAILPETGPHPVPRGTPGLLAVARRDPGLMLGYWRRPAETAAAFRDDWFLTGDRAILHDDDTVTYLGRADDLMNAGGYRVDPAEVEAALRAHPAVAEAAVVERALRPGVTIIAAFYVPHDGPPTDTDLAAHCAARLARYKCPRSFTALPALPRGANGKLLRRALKDSPP